MSRGKKSAAGIIARVLFVLIILGVGTEAVLQLAHLINKGNGRGGEALSGAPVILCLGDSHTYGVKVEPDESYPGQLQELLEENGYEAEVINAGVPGQNTSELRRRLPDLLDRYNPTVVVIMVAANNEWNRKDTIWSDVQDGAVNPGIEGLIKKVVYGPLSSLRTVRLFTYLYNSVSRDKIPNEEVTDREGKVHFHDWRGKGNWDAPENVIKRTRRDLQAIIRAVEDSGAAPVLMTYPGKPFSPMTTANNLIREAARMNNVILVDNHAKIWPIIVDKEGDLDTKAHDRLFLPEEGETHLAAPGYGIVAENLYTKLMARDDIADALGKDK